MKLILKRDDNVEVEIEGIKYIDQKCRLVIFFVDYNLRKEDLELLENKLSKKLKKEVLILGRGFSDKIYTVV